MHRCLSSVVLFGLMAGCAVPSMDEPAADAMDVTSAAVQAEYAFECWQTDDPQRYVANPPKDVRIKGTITRDGVPTHVERTVWKYRVGYVWQAFTPVRSPSATAFYPSLPVVWTYPDAAGQVVGEMDLPSRLRVTRSATWLAWTSYPYGLARCRAL